MTQGWDSFCLTVHGCLQTVSTPRILSNPQLPQSTWTLQPPFLLFHPSNGTWIAGFPSTPVIILDGINIPVHGLYPPLHALPALLLPLPRPLLTLSQHQSELLLKAPFQAFRSDHHFNLPLLMLQLHPPLTQRDLPSSESLSALSPPVLSTHAPSVSAQTRQPGRALRMPPCSPDPQHHPWQSPSPPGLTAGPGLILTGGAPVEKAMIVSCLDPLQSCAHKHHTSTLLLHVGFLPLEKARLTSASLLDSQSRPLTLS